MSTIQDQTVQKYKKKYEMNRTSFNKFVNKNIQFSQDLFQLMEEKISQFQIKNSFDQEDLRILFRLVAAIQKYGQQQVKDMSYQAISQVIQPIHYTSSKKNKAEIQKKPVVSEQNIKVNKSIQSNPSTELVNYPRFSENIKAQIYNEQSQSSSQQNQSNQSKSKESKTQIELIEEKDNKQFAKSRAKILQYQKFSTDYVNTVIKFKIEYQNFTVLRRYSQFQKLMKILGDRFEGYILPQMPPKQAIKSGMSYFWGVDQTFLEERKKKLEELINRLLESKFISNDETLNKFLTDSSFQIQLISQGYTAYLKTFTDIVFNAKQLKDYGLAYCNYLKQKGNIKLNPEIEKKYEGIQEIIKIFADINEYRKKINANFQKRRQILSELGKKCNQCSNTQFNTLMDKIEDQIKNLGTEFGKYRDLKSKESWNKQLIQQKISDGSRGVTQLKEQKNKLESRIQKMQSNLSVALDDFKQTKSKQIKQIGGQLLDWRRKVHP